MGRAREALIFLPKNRLKLKSICLVVLCLCTTFERFTKGYRLASYLNYIPIYEL